MQKNRANLGRFKKLSSSTIIAVYLLILVGGIVRSSGSGMGCPDWPRCFGSWVPPTSADQLPPDYKEIYSDKRHQKNLRMARYLQLAGMDTTADKLMNDESIREEADFNPVKTWIEYVNRLIGVVIGLLIFATFVYSVKLRKSHPEVFCASLLAFIGVVFQGWIGSIVVSTNLLPGMISFHMVLALLIVLLLIYAYFRTTELAQVANAVGSAKVQWLLAVCMVLFLVQLLMGVGVREGVDSHLAAGAGRDEVLEMIGFKFFFHRSFSWLILAGHLLLLYWLWNSGVVSLSSRLASVLTALVVVEIVTGAAMGYFSIPAVLQPVHLLVASVIFGFQVYLFLLVRKSYLHRSLA